VIDFFFFSFVQFNLWWSFLANCFCSFKLLKAGEKENTILLLFVHSFFSSFVRIFFLSFFFFLCFSVRSIFYIFSFIWKLKEKSCVFWKIIKLSKNKRIYWNFTSTFYHFFLLSFFDKAFLWFIKFISLSSKLLRIPIVFSSSSSFTVSFFWLVSNR